MNWRTTRTSRSWAVADARKQGLAEDTDQFHQAVKHKLPQTTAQVERPHGELEEAYRRGDTEAQAESPSGFPRQIPVLPRMRMMNFNRGGGLFRPLYRETVPDGGSYSERSGRVTLSAEQKMAASISGVSLEEYARQASAFEGRET